jgi:hypothetical protein
LKAAEDLKNGKEGKSQKEQGGGSSGGAGK